MKARKHQLLATSALATAAMALPGVVAAETMKPAISVGGYFFHDTHFASQDMDENKSSVLHHLDTEVHFKMNGELDNGLKIGGRIELEGQTGGDQIDETRLDVSGAWGMLRFGTTNSGRYGHSWSVTGPNVAHGITSGVQTEWLVFPAGTGGFAFRKVLGSAHPDVSNDDPALTYFTPRFNGFQLSLTHRPEVQNTGGKNIATSGSDESVRYTNALDGSVQYSGDVGGMKIALMLGGATADAPGAPGGPANPECRATPWDDYQIVNGGLKVSASGFSVGGTMADVDGERTCSVNAMTRAPTITDASGTAYSVGASYGQGPWAVSTTYHDGSVKHNIVRDGAAVPGDSEMSVWAVGARYTLGPGVRVIASYQDAEVTADTGESNEGSAFSLGLAVNF